MISQKILDDFQLSRHDHEASPDENFRVAQHDYNASCNDIMQSATAERPRTETVFSSLGKHQSCGMTSMRTARNDLAP